MENIFDEIGVDLLFEANQRVERPYVTIQMITWSHEKYIVEAVSSILEDTAYNDYELLVSDDASPDNTKEVLLKYLLNYKGQGQVRYFRHRKNSYHGGLGHAILFEKVSRGEIIMSMDGDDFSCANRVGRTAKLWKSLIPKPSMLIVNAFRYIDADGKTDGSLAKVGADIPSLHTAKFYPPEGPFSVKFPVFGTGSVKSAEFEAWNAKLPRYDHVIAGDAVKSRRAMMHRGIWFVNEPLFYYRINNNSISARGNTGKDWIHDRVIRMQLLNDEIKAISPQHRLSLLDWIRIRYWIMRLKLDEFLIDCSNFIWIIVWPLMIFLSIDEAKKCLKKRIKLIVYGNVNAFYKGKSK